MSYERKIWVNNQTKLNANNMNRIEAGVEEANSVAAEALEIASDVRSAASNLNDTCSKLAEKTSDLKNRTESLEQTVTSNKNEIDSSLLIANKSIGSISEKIESVTSKLNTKQDLLKAGVNLKTINNESLLGTGNITVVTDTELPYTELDSVDLNTLSVQGVYKLTNAINTPDDTATSGTLHVNRLSDNGYEQLWYSDSNWARRINVSSVSPEPEPPTPETTYTFTVNNTDYISSTSNQVTISLDAGQEYDLSGNLIGHLEISSSTEPVGPTKLRLKGVNILSDSNSGIVYSPEKKTLIVEVYADTSNYISVPNGSEKDDAAALLSNSDATITGTGFLSLSTNLCHGIKASELVVNGWPIIKINAVHDAFHASKFLRITGGDITIDGCNDAFSAGSADSPDKTTVEMTITDGKFTINKVEDGIFQNKSTVGNCKIIKGDFTIASANIKDMFQEEADGAKVIVYDLCAWSGLSDDQLAEVNARKRTLADQYGECKVTYKNSADETVTLEGFGDTYTLLGSAESKATYYISGNITGKKFISTVEDVNVVLNGVYCNESDESGTVLFDYQNVKGRLEVDFTAGYISYIRKNSGTIFHSDSNISLKMKYYDTTSPQKTSVAYLSAPNGTVVNAYCESTTEYSRVAIANDGICYITDSKVGVVGSCLWLGNEYNKSQSWGKAYIALYLKDNETDASIAWKLTDDAKMSGHIYANSYFLGTAILGKNLVFTDTTKRYFDAVAGTVDSLYSNTPVIYTLADVSTYDINTNIVTYSSDFEIKAAVNFDLTASVSTINEINSNGDWFVYKTPDNYYAKKEVDQLVANARIEAIEQARSEMSAITPKKVALSTDENIAGIKIYKCDSDQEGEDYSAPVFARDGDFGFPCIDGTGQVNFSPSLADGYDVVKVSGDTSKFKNFKTPYTTCKNNVFRITKVSDDTSVSLSAAKESEMEGYSITYKIVIPENYTGPLPVVTEYRTNDAMLSSYSPKVLEFVDKQVIGKSYSKDTGYPDKSVSDAAQVNFTVDWAESSDYTMSVTTSAKNYKNFNIEGNQYQITKIKDNFDVIITIASAKAAYNVTYNAGDYSFSTDSTEIPATVIDGASLTFAFYHQTNKNNPTKDSTCVPDGASGALPTADACLNRISSVTIGGNSYTITADMITVSGKKATVIIPADAVNGDVVITLA